MSASNLSPPLAEDKPPGRSKKKRRANGNSALPLSEYARSIMRTHFDSLLEHESGTRLGEDIEELHDMRVATRRLRAAFEVFEPAFRPRDIRPLLRDLRTARRALGPVRDLDVFIDNARRYETESSQNLQLLVDIWEHDRQSARQQMLSYLDSPDFAIFKTDFDEFLNTPGQAASRFNPRDPYPQLTWQVAPLLIYQRYVDVLACENLIPEASPEQLHDLRIRFKKLRYAIEFLRDVLGKPASLLIDDLKTMQDHLGNLNDAHLSCDLLTAQLARLENESQSLPIGVRPDLGGIIAYLASLHKTRRELAESFPAAWAHFTRPEFRRNLGLALAEL
jgi:CHAD domain-containing protein